MVDHFEPGTGRVPHGVETDRMATLLEAYPRLADKHHDAAGNPPRRTWFFPPHCHRNGNLRKLTALCQQGYGEIELHLHHGKVAPDTPENQAAPSGCASATIRNSASSAPKRGRRSTVLSTATGP